MVWRERRHGFCLCSYKDCDSKEIMKTHLIFICSLIALTACASTQEKPAYREGYHCDRNFFFQAEFARDGQDVLIITEDGQEILLPFIESAQGKKFSNGMTTLWMIDDTVMIEQDRQPLMTNCILYEDGFFRR